MTNVTDSTTWHIANWGTLGWLETGLKAIGIIAGMIAFSQTTTTDAIQVDNIPHGVAIALLGIMTLFVAGAILLRLSQREVISIIFAITNTLGHAGMLYFIIYMPTDSLLPVIFAISYVLGEFVKQRFLITTGYTEIGQETHQMVMLSRGLLAIYLTFGIVTLF